LKGFTGPLAAEDAGELLAEAAPTTQTERLAGIQQNHTTAQAPIVVADATEITAFTAQVGGVAAGTSQGPVMASGDFHLSTGVFDPGNLVSGQT